MKFLSNKEWENFKTLRDKEDKLHEDKKMFEIEVKNARIELDAERARVNHERKMMQETFELKEKKVVAAHEDKLAKELDKMRSKHQEAINRLRTELTEKNRADLEKMLKDNYEKLSSSMTKLHEEGNATTKHMQEMTKEVIRAAGFANGAVRSETMRIEHVNS